MSADRGRAPNDAEARAGENAFTAGLRAGYAHGYDIGLAHGRAETDIEHIDLPSPRLGGPTRGELVARGYIPRNPDRPPALPVRLWSAEDFAKANARDLPTTEAGRAAWRDAVDAGRVPVELAEAFAARTRADEEALRPDCPEALRAEVADAGRRIADLRAQLDVAELNATYERTAARDRQRVADVDAWLEQHGSFVAEPGLDRGRCR